MKTKERLIAACRGLIDMAMDSRTHGPEIYEACEAITQAEAEGDLLGEALEVCELEEAALSNNQPTNILKQKEAMLTLLRTVLAKAGGRGGE